MRWPVRGSTGHEEPQRARARLSVGGAWGTIVTCQTCQTCETSRRATGGAPSR